MEPKAIKQELESAKEESANEDSASDLRSASMAQNLSNHETRIHKNKGGLRPDNCARISPEAAPSTISNVIEGITIDSSNGRTATTTSHNTFSSAVLPSKQIHPPPGAFSPHSTVNGTPTPSPPALTSPMNASSTHSAFHPHSSTHEAHMNSNNGNVAINGSTNGYRQLTKVRRFLTTLQKFASDINSEVGERVRALILNLLSGTIAVEEFHCALQEVTHFPLRSFVLPFLRSHLPLLTRELHALARRGGMTVAQYISVQESNLMDAVAGEPTDFFSSEVTSGKRKLESYLENGDISSGGNSNSTVNGTHSNGGCLSPPPSKRPSLFSPPYPNLGLSPELNLSSRDCKSSSTGGHDDEWKNIHVMLTCILSMVEKTRRALTMLQQREDTSSSSSSVRFPSVTPELRGRPDYDAEVRRHASELVSHAIRSTEDRVAEVKRKAEEAVLEVRKAAVVEVQRAVANAESKAQELVNAERSRMEGLLREVALRESSGGDHKLEAQQACWNCGRKAQDTCSGCNVAKYCSPYCQHKDWDHHHKVCSSALISANPPASKSTCKVHKSGLDVTKAE